MNYAAFNLFGVIACRACEGAMAYVRELPWILVLLCFAASARAQFTLLPGAPDEKGNPQALTVESRFYKASFDLLESGSARSLLYKPLNGHELSAENYYDNRCGMLRDWVRLKDIDPQTGVTDEPDAKDQAGRKATYRVLRQDDEELVVEFEISQPAIASMPWIGKLVHRRKVIFRNDTPAIRVEDEIENTDTEERSIVFDLYNGMSLGRVRSLVAIPGRDGKIVGTDEAEATASSVIFAPELGGSWIGGVNAEGLGGAFSMDWADVDGMFVDIHKTRGSSYGVVMRRRNIPAGQAVVFKYTFMPVSHFGALDGMQDDLAGGILAGEKADEASAAEGTQTVFTAGQAIPLKVFLASGRNRRMQVHMECVRKEDGKVVLKEDQAVELKVSTEKGAETGILNAQLTPSEDGLYVFTVVADGGGGVVLRMEKAFRIGETSLAYEPALPRGEKRGLRDAGRSVADLGLTYNRYDRKFPYAIGYMHLTNAFRNVPNGSHSAAIHVEGGIVDTKDPEFAGKTITIRSMADFDYDGHATRSLRRLVGNHVSLVPGVADVEYHCWTNWVPDVLRLGSSAGPISYSNTNFRVVFHEWPVWPRLEHNEERIRQINLRTDAMIERDGILQVFLLASLVDRVPGGGEKEFPLNSQAYNSMACAKVRDDTVASLTTQDVKGRVMTQILIPLHSPSQSAPGLASAVLLLAESAVLQSKPNGAKPYVIKSVLMTGAQKLHPDAENKIDREWHKGLSNSPPHTVPLDVRQGAGMLRIDRSYAILQQPETPVGAAADTTGWSCGRISPEGTNVYSFVLDKAEDFAATLVWNRHVTGFESTTNWYLNDLDLYLYSRSGDTLGKVVDYSASRIDNVEHLYIPGLPAGAYELAVVGKNVQGEESYGLSWQSLPDNSQAAR